MQLQYTRHTKHSSFKHTSPHGNNSLYMMVTIIQELRLQHMAQLRLRKLMDRSASLTLLPRLNMPGLFRGPPLLGL